MKPIYPAFTVVLLALTLPACADFGVGQRVPAPTAAGQSVTSTPTAPFTWTPVTLPYGLNATGQMAVGGTVDATTRLSVNPQGTGENGLTVNMPSGATGAALQVKTSTGTKVFGVAPSGAVAAAGYGVGSAVGQTVTVTLAGGAGTLTFIGGILTATAGLTVVNTAEQGYPEMTSLTLTVDTAEQGYPEGTG